MVVVLNFLLSKKSKKLNKQNFQLFNPFGHSKRLVKLLEKSVELGRESILFEAAETRDKTEIAELET